MGTKLILGCLTPPGFRARGRPLKQLTALFQALLRRLIALDDTLCRKRGLSTFGTGMHHDPFISSRKKAADANVRPRDHSRRREGMSESPEGSGSIPEG